MLQKLFRLVSNDVVFGGSQVVMKLIKHCHEVDLSAPGGIAQGALLGLVTDTRLEITHAFPFPSSSTGAAGGDDSVDDEDFQLDVMRKLRMVNVGMPISLFMIN